MAIADILTVILAALTFIFAYGDRVISFAQRRLKKPKKGLDLSINEFKVGYSHSGMLVVIDLNLTFKPFFRKSIHIKSIKVNVKYRDSILYFMEWRTRMRSDENREISNGFVLKRGITKQIRMGYKDSDVNKRLNMYADEQNLYGFFQQGNWEIGKYDISLIISNDSGIIRDFSYEVDVEEEYKKLQEYKKNFYDNKKDGKPSVYETVI